MSATVVILTKLPGHLPVKTRLVPVLGAERARELYREMLRDTVALAQRVTARPIVAYSPPDADPHAALPGLDDCAFRPVAGDDGATCLENALADAHDGAPLVALGGDAPDLPPSRIEQVVEALSDHDAVFVPTGDGGFSCLGLRRPVAGLAQGFAYGAPDSLRALEAFFVERGLAATRLEPWPDVDTPEALIAYRRRAFYPARGGAFLARDGAGREDGCSSRKLCFAATNQAFLVDLLFRLSERPGCHGVKYRPVARDGMYLGRAFTTTDDLAGRTWAEFHGHPHVLCTLQDDDFTAGYRKRS